MFRRSTSIIASVTIVLAAALTAAGCGSSSTSATAKASGPNAGAKLTLVAFSTPREAFAKLIPAFQKTSAGAGVTFDQSYGASGDQSRAVENGLAADVVDLSLAPDVTRLVGDKLVDTNWSAGPHHGIVTDSVAVIVVRKGNPKHIRTWDDLLRTGVQVVTPNPFTSGGARWNLMAAYGAWTRGGDTPDAALGKLKQLLKNTPVQPASAREALQIFTEGKGDAMISYENEAITAQKQGADVDYVVPDSTILIENPAAVITKSKSPKAARAFLDFLYTPAAQDIFAKAGYRPVVASELGKFDFPKPAKLFTIDDLGGWDTVMNDFFDRDKGKVASIEQDLGVATSK